MSSKLCDIKTKINLRRDLDGTRLFVRLLFIVIEGSTVFQDKLHCRVPKDTVSSADRRSRRSVAYFPRAWVELQNYSRIIVKKLFFVNFKHTRKPPALSSKALWSANAPLIAVLSSQADAWSQRPFSLIASNYCRSWYSLRKRVKDKEPVNNICDLTHSWFCAECPATGKAERH